MHWEDAAVIIDQYEEEIEAGHPELMTEREYLGDACLWLLIDADGFAIPQRREFVERLVGPTWPIDLVACRAEGRISNLATTRIIENEEKEAFRKRVDSSDAPPPQRRRFVLRTDMCSHYQTLKDAELLLKKFGVRERPAAMGKYDIWPRYQGVFVHRPVEQTRATKRCLSGKQSFSAGV